MFRTLFFRELRAGLIREAFTLGAVLGPLLIIGQILAKSRSLTAADVTEVISLGAMACVVLLSFAAGERTFPPALKERQVLFLYSLPVRREAVWLGMVGGRLTANLLCGTAVFISGLALLFPTFAPPILYGLTTGRIVCVGLIAALALKSLFFLAGTCFAQLFRRTPLVYLTGGSLLAVLVLQIVGYEHLRGPTAFPGWSYLFSRLTILLLPLALTFAAYSLFWFLSGPRRAIQRAMDQLLLYLALIGCLAWAAISALALPLPERFWKEENPDSWARAVSCSGRFVLISEYYGSRSRLRAVEAATGRIAGQWTGAGLLWVSWSDRDDTIDLIHRAGLWLDPWGVVLGKPVWTRRSVSFEEIGRVQVEGFRTAYWEEQVDKSFIDRRVYRKGPREFLLRLFSGGWGWGFWTVVDGVARELPTVSPSGLPTILEPDGNGEAEQVLTKIYDRPRDPSGKHLPGHFEISYLSPTIIDPRLRTDSLYFLAESGEHPALWVQNPRATGWKKLTDKLFRSRNKARGQLFGNQSVKLAISPGAGLALFALGGEETGWMALYDSRSDHIVKTRPCRNGIAWIRVIDGAPGRIPFQVLCSSADILSGHSVRYFLYHQQSRRLAEVATISCPEQYLVYLDEKTAIWSGTLGWTVVRNGNARRFWPPTHRNMP